jgi:hypothetical protein
VREDLSGQSFQAQFGVNIRNLLPEYFKKGNTQVFANNI